jgi:hypothetical protein
MGWINRLKLKSLPIMDFDEIRTHLLSSAGFSTDGIDGIKEDVEKHLLQEFNSLDQVESYVNEAKSTSGFGFYSIWKKIGPYLLKFSDCESGIKLGMPVAPSEYIVRTGKSIWRAYKIPREIQKMIETQLIEDWKRRIGYSE